MKIYKNSIERVGGVWTVWAFNSKAASILNHRLRTYDVPLNEWGDSEGIFKVPDKDYKWALAVITKFGGIENL